MATVTEVCVPHYLILVALHWRLHWGPGYKMSSNKHRDSILSILILLHCKWRRRRGRKLPGMVTNAEPHTCPC